MVCEERKSSGPRDSCNPGFKGVQLGRFMDDLFTHKLVEDIKTHAPLADPAPILRRQVTATRFAGSGVCLFGTRGLRLLSTSFP